MGRWETIESGGHSMRVYLAVPSGKRTASAVVVAQHGPGVDRFIEDRVDRLAEHGYVAAAPDLYHRQPQDGAEVMTRIGRLRDPEIVIDVDATVEHVRRLPDLQVADIGVTGFCMGGRVAYLMAASNPDLKAAGVFYGGNIMKPWGDGPSPFEQTPRISCPIIGFFGDEDANPSPADVKTIDAELDRLGKPHEFHSYANAGHAFLNFTNPAVYREAPARDAWQKLLAFFDQRLAPAA